MFRRPVENLDKLLNQFLRNSGLETPLMQRRLLAAWDGVVGPTIARYTTNKFIRNQTLFVQISSPALRAELGMMRSQLVAKLNQQAGGTQIVTDVRFF